MLLDSVGQELDHATVGMAGIIRMLLRSRVWLPSWDDHKAEFSCDCQPVYPHVASPCGLGFLQYVGWVPRGAV